MGMIKDDKLGAVSDVGSAATHLLSFHICAVSYLSSPILRWHTQFATCISLREDASAVVVYFFTSIACLLTWGTHSAGALPLSPDLYVRVVGDF